MRRDGWSIGDLSRATGVKATTIRYYEQIGLVPAPPRSEGGRRVYGAADSRRLAFIRHARGLGFDIEAIRTLLDLQDRPDQSCAGADSIARRRLAEVERRIAILNALKAELERMISTCAHGKIADCRVIEVLADHAHCGFHADLEGEEADSGIDLVRKAARTMAASTTSSAARRPKRSPTKPSAGGPTRKAI